LKKGHIRPLTAKYTKLSKRPYQFTHSMLNHHIQANQISPKQLPNRGSGTSVFTVTHLQLMIKSKKAPMYKKPDLRDEFKAYLRDNNIPIVKKGCTPSGITSQQS
jgi:hypothetical protein